MGKRKNIPNCKYVIVFLLSLLADGKTNDQVASCFITSPMYLLIAFLHANLFFIHFTKALLMFLASVGVPFM